MEKRWSLCTHTVTRHTHTFFDLCLVHHLPPCWGLQAGSLPPLVNPCNFVQAVGAPVNEVVHLLHWAALQNVLELRAVCLTVLPEPGVF